MAKRFASAGASHKSYISICICIVMCQWILLTPRLLRSPIKCDMLCGIQIHTHSHTRTHMRHTSMSSICVTIWWWFKLFIHQLMNPKFRIQFSMAWTFEYELSLMYGSLLCKLKLILMESYSSHQTDLYSVIIIIAILHLDRNCSQ